MLDSCNIVEKQSEAFHTFLWHFFPSLIHNFIAYRYSKVSDCIFEIPQLWQSGFTRVYSNCCCSCSFEAEIIKNGPSSHNMYSNNILNFQESKTILNACTKTSLETYWMHLVYWPFTILSFKLHEWFYLIFFFVKSLLHTICLKCKDNFTVIPN